MGTTERKEREKRQMRESIIEAARELFVREGIEKTSLRAIAKKIEYSPATIYLYFKDKDEILYAVHEKAFRMFLNEFEKVSVIENPMERLRELGRQYIRFAVKHPEYYDLMFILRAPMTSEKAHGEYYIGKESYDFLHNTVQECIEKGYMREQNTHKASFMIWSYVHGSVSLYIRARMTMYPPEMVEDLLSGAFELFANSTRHI